MRHLLRTLLKDESGTVAIEYGLILTLITIILIGSMISVGASVNGFFTNTLNALTR